MKAVTTRNKYEVIREMSKEHYPILFLCEIAHVARSGYYKWLKRKIWTSEKQLDVEEIKNF